MPFVIAFIDVDYDDPIFIFEAVLDGLFFTDILITLNTAVILKNGKILMSRYKIFKNYLKGMLVIDILAVIPFYLITESGSSRSSAFIRFIRLAKLVRIFRASKILQIVKHISSSE